MCSRPNPPLLPLAQHLEKRRTGIQGVLEVKEDGEDSDRLEKEETTSPPIQNCEERTGAAMYNEVKLALGELRVSVEALQQQQGSEEVTQPHDPFLDLFSTFVIGTYGLS